LELRPALESHRAVDVRAGERLLARVGSGVDRNLAAVPEPTWAHGAAVRLGTGGIVVAVAVAVAVAALLLLFLNLHGVVFTARGRCVRETTSPGRPGSPAVAVPRSGRFVVMRTLVQLELERIVAHDVAQFAGIIIANVCLPAVVRPGGGQGELCAALVDVTGGRIDRVSSRAVVATVWHVS